MFIEKQYSFDSMHFLPRHTGKCREVHGHTYTVAVGIVGNVNPDTGFILDYNILDEIVKPLIKMLDHKTLNCFIKYPSAENIATFFAHELYAKLNHPGFEDMTIVVSETPKTQACWKMSSSKDFARFNEPLDAEWRSPQIDSCINVPEGIDEAKSEAEAALENFVYWQTRLEQLRLYRDSATRADLKKELGL